MAFTTTIIIVGYIFDGINYLNSSIVIFAIRFKITVFILIAYIIIMTVSATSDTFASIIVFDRLFQDARFMHIVLVVIAIVANIVLTIHRHQYPHPHHHRCHHRHHCRRHSDAVCIFACVGNSTGYDDR